MAGAAATRELSGNPCCPPRTDGQPLAQGTRLLIRPGGSLQCPSGRRMGSSHILLRGTTSGLAVCPCILSRVLLSATMPLHGPRVTWTLHRALPGWHHSNWTQEARSSKALCMPWGSTCSPGGGKKPGSAMAARVGRPCPGCSVVGSCLQHRLPLRSTAFSRCPRGGGARSVSGDAGQLTWWASSPLVGRTDTATAVMQGVPSSGPQGPAELWAERHLW